MSLSTTIDNMKGRDYREIITNPQTSRTFSYTAGVHTIHWVHYYPLPRVWTRLLRTRLAVMGIATPALVADAGTSGSRARQGRCCSTVSMTSRIKS